MTESREADEDERLKLLRHAVRAGATDISSGRFSEHHSSRSLKTSLSKHALAAIERIKHIGA